MTKDTSEKVAAGKTGSSKYPPNHKLRQAREVHLLTREELAEKVGVNARTIARWEQGDALPHPLNIRQLCERLRMKPHELGLEVAGESVALEQQNQVSLPLSMQEPAAAPHEGGETSEEVGTQRFRLSRRKLVLGGAIAVMSLTLAGGAYTFLRASENKQLARYYYKSEIMSLAWSADGAYLASAHADHTVQIWNSVTGDRTAYTHHTSGWVSDVVWSPQGGGMLASVSGGNDPMLCVWKFPLEDQDMLKVRHPYRLTTVAWSPDGKFLAFAGRSQIVEIVEVASPEKANVVTIPDTGGIQKIRWSPDGLSLVIGTTNGAIYLYHTQRQNMRKFSQDHSGIVEDVALSPDGKVVASASADGTVLLWDIMNLHVLSTYKGHSKKVSSVAWSPDGKVVASASADGTVHLSHMETGALLTSYEGSSKGELNAVSWASSGKYIAFGGEKREIVIRMIP